jgi:GTP-binding protein LepA
MSDNIRNFSIIAHIDHGKSTLADRMLEITHTIEPRHMQAQVLDRMDLERERGITIKMQPVRMEWKSKGADYVINLIDTPGHVDFAYEVSRALTAVEGVVLLVDATQGVEAQTLSVLGVAQSLNLPIIPVVSKIDAPAARFEDIRTELAMLLKCSEDDVLGASGKTGAGVADVLDAVVARIPPPRSTGAAAQALIFDFGYSDHRGVIVYARVFGGSIKKGDSLKMLAAKAEFIALEVGVMKPQESPQSQLVEGDIGYIVTGIKKAGIVSVGDTVTTVRNPAEPFAGYEAPTPVIWASVYPESQDDLIVLRQSLERLRLSDSSLSYEEESSGVMGKGFRCGFLGMLHLEIIIERLKREFTLELVVTMPTTIYEVTHMDGRIEEIYAPARLPDEGQYKGLREMWADIVVISPPEALGGISQLLYDHEGEVGDTVSLPDGKTETHAKMPLRELMRGFFDRLKSVSPGYGVRRARNSADQAALATGQSSTAGGHCRRDLAHERPSPSQCAGCWHCTAVPSPHRRRLCDLRTVHPAAWSKTGSRGTHSTPSVPYTAREHWRGGSRHSPGLSAAASEDSRDKPQDQRPSTTLHRANPRTT